MTTQRLRTFYSVLLLSFDVVALILAFGFSYKLREWLPFPEPLITNIPFSTYYTLLIIFVACVLFVLFLHQQYYIPRAPSRVAQIYAVITSTFIGTATAIAIATFLFKGKGWVVDFPRAMLVYAWLNSIIMLIVARLVHYGLRDFSRRRGVGRDRLIIVGTGEIARHTLQRILWSPQLGYEVVGVVSPNQRMKKLLGVPIIGRTEDLPALIEKERIDEVIIAIPELGHREVVHTVSFCQRGRVSIKIFPDVFQFITGEATIDDLGGLPLLTVRDFALRGYMLVFKRVIDIVGALIGLLICSPLMLLGALAVKLESRGPAFFVQERMGLDGQVIRILKFRSMRQDAEHHGPGWTVQNDPRRTRLGTILRKTNFDELPQLINILLGEMSLVGPRPEQPYYVEQFRETVPNYMQRHLLPAGLTGWAQVNGLRGDTSILERTKYDLWYIENWSLLLDLTIIIRTIWQTIIGRNIGAG